MKLSDRMRNMALSWVAPYEHKGFDLIIEVTRLEARIEQLLKEIGAGTTFLSNRIAELEAKNEAARAIMQKFVGKVDRGMARSIETYAEMKQWMEE